MHDLDRVQMETGNGEYLEGEAFEYQEAGETYEGEGEYEYGETYELPAEASSPFQEQEEMELAAELLEVTNEEELDHFLGNLIRNAAQKVGGLIKTPVGRALGGFLKGAIKKALPIVGGALGGFVGGPAGAALGGRLAPMAGNLLGLELEGLSNEDQEYEAARQLVRFAGAATSRAATAPQAAPPQAIAQNAVSAAAQSYAPGMLKGSATTVSGNMRGRRGKTGKWIRRGGVIILFGA